MACSKTFIPIAAALMLTGVVSHAQTDSYGDAFSHYQPYVTPAVPKKKQESPAAPAPAPAAAKPENKEAPVDVRWLRENYPLLEERAINNPTKDNVSAYLYTKRVILDKSQRFGNAALDALNEDPILSENTRIPYASGGAQAVRNANYRAESQAVEELAKTGGLLVFVDGTCRFCAMEMPVIQALKNNTKMEFLVISIDGGKPSNYQGAVQKDNGLYGKLGLKVTPSIVYVSRPRGYGVGADPNVYYVVSQGFYAQDEIAKQIAYAGYKNNLLSKPVMQALGVWDTGVATVDDLSQLRLDINKPAEFKQKLQPLLLKQLQQE